MKIAILTNLSRNYFTEECHSMNNALDTIREDVDIEWHLTNATRNRVYGSTDIVVHSCPEDCVQVILVAEDIDDSVIRDKSDMSENALANDLLDDYQDSFRFSAATQARLSSLFPINADEEDSFEEPEQDTDDLPDLDTSSTTSPTIGENQSTSANHLVPVEIEASDRPVDPESVSHNEPQNTISRNAVERHMTVGELIDALRAFPRNAPLYNESYREGAFVEYNQPKLRLVDEARTNIDNPDEHYPAGHVVIYV